MIVTGDTGVRSSGVAAEGAGSSHAQWGAIAAGSLAGFAATVLMATLGAAIGMTAGASLADEPMNGGQAEKTALGFGLGMAVWTVLSGIVAGAVGGCVLHRMARYDRPYLPVSSAVLTWTGGVFLALLVASPGTAGLLGAAGGVVAEARNEIRRPADPAERTRTAQAGEQASKAAAAGAWVALAAQLLSLGATILAARSSRVRMIPVKTGPQLT